MFDLEFVGRFFFLLSVFSLIAMRFSLFGIHITALSIKLIIIKWKYEEEKSKK